jgi:hypothetical protein
MGAFRAFYSWRPYKVYNKLPGLTRGEPPIQPGEILQETGYRLLTEDGNYLALEEGN